MARIAESGSSALPMVLESKEVKEEKVGDKKKRKTLRVGSEGEEVRAMQVCSHSLFLLSSNFLKKYKTKASLMFLKCLESLGNYWRLS